MDNALRTDLLPAALPTAWLAVIACVAIGVLAAAHILFVKQNRSPLLRFIVALPIGAMACWLWLQLVARIIVIATPWPLWAMALVAAASTEGAVLIYNHERMLCPPQVRRILLALRLAAIAIVCIMLAQPVLQRDFTRHIRRRVAVLVDASESMQRSDRFWTSAEKLDIAQTLGVVKPSSRPLRLAATTNEAFRIRLAYWTERLAAPDTAETVTTRNTLYEDADSAAKWAEKLAGTLAAIPAPAPVPDALRNDAARLAEFRNTLTNRIAPPLHALARGRKEHEAASTTNRPPETAVRNLNEDLAKASQALDALQEAIPPAQAAADALLAASLSPEASAAISNACAMARFEIARSVLAGSTSNNVPSFLDNLSRNYDLDVFTFARNPARVADPKAWIATPADNTTNATQAMRAERAETDVAQAIETVSREIPSEERAGMLLLTDGCHTGDAGVEAIARQLGQSKTPVSSIVIGGTQAPFDFSLETVRAQESVFLGDRVRIAATLAATAASGAKTRVVLRRDGTVVDSEDVGIEGNDWRSEFRLEDMPDARGTYKYEIAIEPDPREAIPENNRWTMDVAVSDNRTHVLVVDRRPRWEFRYLRNLFYGRDKSIHLQYYLSEPDTIRGVLPKEPLPPASASREFGDAEAGALPTTLEEWRKFDVIVLGDLSEKTLTHEAVESIRHCVETRGATLICIAGTQAMPHAISNSVFTAMLPVTCASGERDYSVPPEKEFQVELTPAGLTHAITSLSASQAENISIWSGLQPWRWRLPVESVKPAAEILAIARPREEDNDSATFTLSEDDGKSPEAAVSAFAKMRREQMRRAVVVTQQYGAGKVMVLLSDSTWRLRYGVGDTLHHRLWGQIMRWAAGEQMRAGNAYARMGTDRITYTPDEPVTVRARFADADFKPLAELKVQAVMSDKEGVEIARQELSYRTGSNGFYEGVFRQPLDPKAYTVRLDVPALDGILGEHAPESLECAFTVVTSRRPRESARATADWRVPLALAAQSGGKAISPVEAGSLETAFGEPSRTVVERREIQLWSTPLLFLLLVGVLTAEWILRKKGGLT